MAVFQSLYFLSALLLFFCLPAQAAPVLIFDTGVDAAGDRLGTLNVRQTDLHYSVYRVTNPSATAGVAGWSSTLLPTDVDGNVAQARTINEQNNLGNFVNPFANNAWGNTTTTGIEARWIGWHASAGAGHQAPQNSYYVYTTTFDLTGFNPATASLSGNWAIDNADRGSIFLNGIATGLTFSANTATPVAVPGSAFSISTSSLFLPGLNSLQFVVFNNGNNASNNNRTGLLVSGLSLDAMAVPELQLQQGWPALLVVAGLLLCCRERRQQRLFFAGEEVATSG